MKLGNFGGCHSILFDKILLTGESNDNIKFCSYVIVENEGEFVQVLLLQIDKEVEASTLVG